MGGLISKNSLSMRWAKTFFWMITHGINTNLQKQDFVHCEGIRETLLEEVMPEQHL